MITGNAARITVLGAGFADLSTTRALRREGRRDRFELVFFSPVVQPGTRLGPKAVTHLLTEKARRGIRTHLGHTLTHFKADQVVTEGGAFAADLILLMPGVTGHAWFDGTVLPRSPGRLIQADAHCRVPGLQRVPVAGDSGSVPGPDWMPKQAHMADLQAATAAANLLGDLAGRPVNDAVKVELICIVDAIAHGTLVYRTTQRHLLLPAKRLFHWTQRFFEWRYLRAYR